MSDPNARLDLSDYPTPLEQTEETIRELEKRIQVLGRRNSVLQPWVEKLTHMQQSVLITATRGPDGLPKEHISKTMLRWLRRCFLYCAFGHKIKKTPYEPGGGSFTGPCPPNLSIKKCFEVYLHHIDEVPHHFHLHLMHAAEILGYKHPDEEVSKGWFDFYKAIVKDAHLNIETEKQMDFRLGDSEKHWKEQEDNSPRI